MNSEPADHRRGHVVGGAGVEAGPGPAASSRFKGRPAARSATCTATIRPTSPFRRTSGLSCSRPAASSTTRSSRARRARPPAGSTTTTTSTRHRAHAHELREGGQPQRTSVVDSEGGVRTCPGAAISAAVGRARGPQPALGEAIRPRGAAAGPRRLRSAGTWTPRSIRRRWSSRRDGPRDRVSASSSPIGASAARAALGCVVALEASGPTRSRSWAKRWRELASAAVCQPRTGSRPWAGCAFAPDGRGEPGVGGLRAPPRCTFRGAARPPRG